MSVKVMNDKRVNQQVEKVNAKGITHYVGEIKSEFQKISWTSREELRTYTQVVVASTFIFGLGVYGIDLGIQRLLAGLNFAIRMITG